MATERTERDTWDEEKVNKLLDLWAEETIQFSIDNAKTSKEKTAVYQTLQVQLEQQGVKCDLKSIISKIRKMRQKYKEEKTKANKSGRARGRKWKFFDKMDSIMGHRANISPPLVYDSSVRKNGQTEEGNVLVSEDREVGSGIHDEDESTADISGSGNVEGRSIPTPQGDTFGMSPEADAATGVSTDVTSVEAKPYGVKGKSSNMTKKTKLERSLEVLCDKMISSSTSEMDRFFKMEEDRHKREMAQQLEQAKLEATRRREEREHELKVLQLLTGTTHVHTANMQSSSIGPERYWSSGYDDSGTRSFGFGHSFMGGALDQSSLSSASSERSYTTL